MSVAYGADMNIILCHGSWYGPGSWARLAAELEHAGHSTTAVTYPGDAGDGTPASDIHLSSYVDAVVAAIDASTGPVTLVGHSMGGTVISHAADRRPDAVERSIYISAFLLPEGQSLFAFSQSAPEFATSLLPAHLVIDEEHGVSSIAEDGFREAFAADADDETYAWARSQAQQDYLEPSGTPAHYEGGFARVPRFYVETTEDRAVPVEAQRAMQKLGVEAVASVAGSHSAYITRPAEVAAAILGFAS